MCVHNAEVLINGIAGIPLGYITIINPVVASIGATIALSMIAQRSYEAYNQTYQEGEKHTLPTNAICAERDYYLQRLNELKALYQDLVEIKNGLEGIQALLNDNCAFTYHLLKEINTPNFYTHNPLLDISLENELVLCNKQKENLRIMREQELKYLEKEIISLQYTLAFHINELINRLHIAHNEYNKAQKEITQAADAWNKHRDCMNNAIALEVYKITLLDDHLLSDFNQKLNEVKIVVQYYNSCVNTLCIKQSSNITELFEQLTPIITEYDEWVTKQRSRIDKNIFGIEKYFADIGILITQIKQQTKNQLEKDRSRRKTQALTVAKDKMEIIAVAGSPNNNDDDSENNNDEEKDVLIEIYEKNAPHIFRKETGHLSDTPGNRKLLIETASNEKNFLGTCKYGNKWYSKILENGHQVWVSVRKGFIRNGGINDIVREFNFETGLARAKGSICLK